MKVRFVKQYTNYSGSVFRRYERDGDRPLLERTVDVCIRPGRSMLYRLSNGEAKLEAERIFEERVISGT